MLAERENRDRSSGGARHHAAKPVDEVQYRVVKEMCKFGARIIREMLHTTI